MKVTLESTTKIVELRIGGPTGPIVPTRVWQGETEHGVRIHAYVTRIAVAEGQDMAEFERDLEALAAPRPEIAALPARLVV